MDNKDRFRRDFAELVEMADASALGMSRTYLDFGPMRIYIRIGPRYVVPPGKEARETVSCVQIANVDTPDVDQGKGLFTELLVCIGEVSDRPIYVEQVLNHRFAEGLLRRGFVVSREDKIGTKDLIRWPPQS